MLTGQKVKALKPKDKQYKVSDKKGLYLLVKTNGSKYWRLKYRLSGKEKNLALGVYPNVSKKCQTCLHCLQQYIEAVQIASIRRSVYLCVS